MESLYPQRLGVGQATAKTRAKENNIKAHVLQRHPIKCKVDGDVSKIIFALGWQDIIKMQSKTGF